MAALPVAAKTRQIMSAEDGPGIDFQDPRPEIYAIDLRLQRLEEVGVPILYDHPVEPLLGAHEGIFVFYRICYQAFSAIKMEIDDYSRRPLDVQSAVKDLVMAYRAYNLALCEFLSVLEHQFTYTMEEIIKLVATQLRRTEAGAWIVGDVSKTASIRSLRTVLKLREIFVTEVTAHLISMRNNSPGSWTPIVHGINGSLKENLDTLTRTEVAKPPVFQVFSADTIIRMAELEEALSASPAYRRLYFQTSRNVSYVSDDTSAGGSRARSKSLFSTQISI